eukprot:422057-Amphidinium_carterae.1
MGTGDYPRLWARCPIGARSASHGNRPSRLHACWRLRGSARLPMTLPAKVGMQSSVGFNKHG